MNLTVLIVTALSLEFEAVRNHLIDIQVIVHPDTSTVYNVGLFKGYSLDCKIVVLESGPGNVNASHETERAISYFKPDYLFFVGVGGGIKDVELGDVVISSKIIGYETGKVDDYGFKPRFEVAQASYALEQVAKHVNRVNSWLQRIKIKTGDNPNSFIGSIATGEKVVASTREPSYKFIRQYCSDALAIEMEGIGFLQSVRAHFTHGIVVRGISDMLKSKHEADIAGWQPKAADHASAFTFEMIACLAGPLFFKMRTPKIDSRINLEYIQGTIISPKNGEFHSSTIECAGMIKNLPTGVKLCVAVEVLVQNKAWKIWPKKASIIIDEIGNWRASIFHDSKSDGERFAVSLWVLPPDAQSEVESWLKSGEEKVSKSAHKFKGLSWLSPDGHRLARISNLVYSI